MMPRKGHASIRTRTARGEDMKRRQKEAIVKIARSLVQAMLKQKKKRNLACEKRQFHVCSLSLIFDLKKRTFANLKFMF